MHACTFGGGTVRTHPCRVIQLLETYHVPAPTTVVAPAREAPVSDEGNTRVDQNSPVHTGKP